jgi:fibronectin-binding autotransporter adhesin
MTANGIDFEPFVNAAYVHLNADGFTETGGPAALTSDGITRDVPYTTLGLRAATDITAGDSLLRVHGLVGWQHAYSDVVPTQTFAFTGSDAFEVSGVPIARDALVLEAGANWHLTEKTSLDLTYSGQLGSGAQEHTLKGTLSVKF